MEKVCKENEFLIKNQFPRSSPSPSRASVNHRHASLAFPGSAHPLWRIVHSHRDEGPPERVPGHQGRDPQGFHPAGGPLPCPAQRGDLPGKRQSYNESYMHVYCDEIDCSEDCAVTARKTGERVPQRTTSPVSLILPPFPLPFLRRPLPHPDPLSLAPHALSLVVLLLGSEKPHNSPPSSPPSHAPSASPSPPAHRPPPRV
jgi:hypothetical protein